MTAWRLAYIFLVAVLLLPNTCIGASELGSGDGSEDGSASLGCNKTDQVDQYCHNCKNGDFSRCEDNTILMSEGSQDRSDCVDDCKNNTECLGVHYHLDNRYCTYLIKCTYLYMTATNKNGYLYRKSCNKDCPNFTLSSSAGMRIHCHDTSFTTDTLDVDMWDCVELCADTEGCRAVTHAGSTCALSLCDRYVNHSSPRSTSFMKQCITSNDSTTIETTTTSIHVSTSKENITSAQESSYDTTRNRLITIGFKTNTTANISSSHKGSTAALMADVSAHSTDNPRTPAKGITPVTVIFSTTENSAIRMELSYFGYFAIAHYVFYFGILKIREYEQ